MNPTASFIAMWTFVNRVFFSSQKQKGFSQSETSGLNLEYGPNAFWK